EHGWIDAGDLEALTGERRAPSVGRWVVDPTALEQTCASVRQRVLSSGELGLDVAALDDRERAALSTLDDITVDAGRARHHAARDPLADHPFVAALLVGGAAPPQPDGIDRAQLRELVRRRLVVERDGIYFHPDTIDLAAHAAAALLREHPGGFTVGQFREALSITRKHAVPLAAELDSRGITRRRDDLRIPGPKLPAP
ncbi:MAG: selenocysteine-specific elongation factor, partial [Actinomycetota bacterium]